MLKTNLQGGVYNIVDVSLQDYKQLKIHHGENMTTTQTKPATKINPFKAILSSRNESRQEREKAQIWIDNLDMDKINTASKLIDAIDVEASQTSSKPYLEELYSFRKALSKKRVEELQISFKSDLDKLAGQIASLYLEAERSEKSTINIDGTDGRSVKIDITVKAGNYKRTRTMSPAMIAGVKVCDTRFVCSDSSDTLSANELCDKLGLKYNSPSDFLRKWEQGAYASKAHREYGGTVRIAMDSDYPEGLTTSPSVPVPYPVIDKGFSL